jgi:hypothetical protein
MPQTRKRTRSRRKRSFAGPTASAIGDILTEVEALDLVTDRALPTARTIASTCRRYAPSAYDAAYFELAMRIELLLAAKDGPKSSKPHERRA